MNYFFYIVPFLFFTQFIFAQNNSSNLSHAEIDSLMVLEYSKGDYNSAISYLIIGKNKAEFEFGIEDSLYSEYAYNLAICYSLTNQISKAEELFLEVLELRREIFGDKHSLYANVLRGLGDLYLSSHQFEKSEQSYFQALAIYEKTLDENSNGYMSTLNSLASLFDAKGDYEKAEAFYLKIIASNKDVSSQNSRLYDFALQNLGSLYREMGHYEKAEFYLFKAKENIINSLGESHPDYVTIIGHIGGLFLDMGSLEKAETFFKQAIDLDAKTVGEEDPYYAMSLNSLAVLYSKMNRFDEAIPIYRKVLKIYKKAFGEEDPNYFSGLRDLAGIYLQLNDLEKAEALGLEAKKIAVKLYDKQDYRYGLTLELLGLINQKKKDYLKAERLLLQAHETYVTSLSDNPNYSIVSYRNLSALSLSMGNLDQALIYSLQSIHVNSEGIDAALNDFSTFDINKFTKLEYKVNAKISKSLEQLLIVLEAQYDKTKDPKKLDQHYSLAKVAMNLNERFRNSLGGEKDKLRTSSTNTFFIRHGIESALLLEGEAHKKEAFIFIERNKSALLLDAVKGNRARNLSDLPDSLVAKEIAYQKNYASLKKEQYEGTAEEKSSATKEIGILQMEMNDFIKEIKQKYPKYHQLKYANIITNTEEVQGLLDNETLFLEYFLTDSLLYLFAISKDELSLYPIKISLSKLKKEIKALRFALSNYNYIIKKEDQAFNLYTKTAVWFYDNILSIALQDKNYKNLIIVTDGELGYLPFETFLTTTPKAQNINYKNLDYLVNDYSITYNYSATLWKENLTAPKKQNNGKMLGCVSSYSKVDSSLKELRLPYYYELRSILKPLPAAEAEIVLLSENFEGDFLKGTASNEKNFKEQAHSYGVIHLAMHGVLHPQIPMLSSLVFTENKDSLEDNFLQAFEIARLGLNADLVVLSACETGYGKFEQGEGVMSLARSFMYAGVSSLVVSLWQVNDNSTEIIMKNFYQNLANGMNKAEALRQSKLFYLKNTNGVAGHPAFWSPFIQLGNSDPIQLSNKNRYKFVWFGLGVLAFLGIGGFLIKRKNKESV